MDRIFYRLDSIVYRKGRYCTVWLVYSMGWFSIFYRMECTYSEGGFSIFYSRGLHKLYKQGLSI